MGVTVALSNLRAALAEVRAFRKLTNDSAETEGDPATKSSYLAAGQFFSGIEQKIDAAISELESEGV